MTDMPCARVDVLIPTFNRGDMLPECLRSILNQTEQDFRIVIYDDGSTDGSTDPGSIPDDPRIEIYNRGGEHKGVAAARNALLGLITAPFACWQDSDDRSHQERLERMVSHLEREGSDAAFSYLNFFNGSWSQKHWHLCVVDTSKWRVPDENGDPADWGMRNNTSFASGFFRKELAETKFDVSFRVAEDWDWIKRLIQQGFRITTEPKVYYYARRHPGRLTVQARRRRQ